MSQQAIVSYSTTTSYGTILWQRARDVALEKLVRHVSRIYSDLLNFTQTLSTDNYRAKSLYLGLVAWCLLYYRKSFSYFFSTRRQKYEEKECKGSISFLDNRHQNLLIQKNRPLTGVKRRESFHRNFSTRSRCFDNITEFRYSKDVSIGYGSSGTVRVFQRHKWLSRHLESFNHGGREVSLILTPARERRLGLSRWGSRFTTPETERV